MHTVCIPRCHTVIVVAAPLFNVSRLAYKRAISGYVRDATANLRPLTLQSRMKPTMTGARKLETTEDEASACRAFFQGLTWSTILTSGLGV